MQPRETDKYHFDIAEAADLIVQYTVGKTFADIFLQSTQPAALHMDRYMEWVNLLSQGPRPFASVTG